MIERLKETEASNQLEIWPDAKPCIFHKFGPNLNLLADLKDGERAVQLLPNHLLPQVMLCSAGGPYQDLLLLFGSLFIF